MNVRRFRGGLGWTVFQKWLWSRGVSVIAILEGKHAGLQAAKGADPERMGRFVVETIARPLLLLQGRTGSLDQLSRGEVGWSGKDQVWDFLVWTTD